MILIYCIVLSFIVFYFNLCSCNYVLIIINELLLLLIIIINCTVVTTLYGNDTRNLPTDPIIRNWVLYRERLRSLYRLFSQEPTRRIAFHGIVL